MSITDMIHFCFCISALASHSDTVDAVSGMLQALPSQVNKTQLLYTHLINPLYTEFKSLDLFFNLWIIKTYPTASSLGYFMLQTAHRGKVSHPK